MAVCLITGTIFNGDESPAPGARLSITKVVSLGKAISHAARQIIADAEGNVTFEILRGATITLQGEVIINGTDLRNGKAFDVPNAETERIENLVPPTFPITQTAFLAYIGAYTQTIEEDTTLDIGASMRAVILIVTSDSDVTATLPPIAGMASRSIVLKKDTDDDFLAIVDGFEGELIEGALVYNLDAKDTFVEVAPVNGQWRVIGKG